MTITLVTPPPFWLTPAEAQCLAGCRSIDGWYAWRKRHGLVPRADGRVSRLDIQRALQRKAKKRRHMAAASLANLRQNRQAS